MREGGSSACPYFAAVLKTCQFASLAGEPEAREDVLRMHMLEGNLLGICIAAAAALGSMNPASWPTRLATNLGVAD